MTDQPLWHRASQARITDLGDLRPQMALRVLHDMREARRRTAQTKRRQEARDGDS